MGIRKINETKECNSNLRSTALQAIFCLVLFVPVAHADIIDTVWYPHGGYGEYRAYARHLTDEGIAAADSWPLEGPADWPQYQGNAQHVGYNPTEIIEPPLSIRWYKKIVDWPLLAPTVVGNRVLVFPAAAGLSPVTGSFIECLDVTDGAILWRGDFGGVWNNSHAVYADSLVYIHVEPALHIAACMDIVEGELRWISNLAMQAYRPLTLTIYNGRAFIADNFHGGMHTLDAKTGDWLWRVQFPNDDRWTQAVYQDRVYSFLLRKLFVSDAATGDTLYLVDTDTISSVGDSRDDPDLPLQSNAYGQHAAPILDTTTMRLYCHFYYDYYCFDVADEPRLLWKATDTSSLRSMPALYDTLLITTCDPLLKVRSTTTGEVLWTFEGEKWFVPGFPPIVANGYIFCSSPIVNISGYRSPGWTYAIDIETRECVWKTPQGGFITVANGQLYIASKDGYLYCYGSMATGVEDDDQDLLPSDFALFQNYPNPFNPSTEIRFSLTRAGDVSLDIYNMTGQKVTTLADGSFSAGTHSVVWDGSGYASGVYVYRLTVNDLVVDSKKMTLVK